MSRVQITTGARSPMRAAAVASASSACNLIIGHTV
jgi:hypothetical protein